MLYMLLGVEEEARAVPWESSAGKAAALLGRQGEWVRIRAVREQQQQQQQQPGKCLLAPKLLFCYSAIQLRLDQWQSHKRLSVRGHLQLNGNRRCVRHLLMRQTERRDFRKSAERSSGAVMGDPRPPFPVFSCDPRGRDASDLRDNSRSSSSRSPQSQAPPPAPRPPRPPAL